MSFGKKAPPYPELPADRLRRNRILRRRILLCILSGVMLGASFPPSHAGILACIGLIPLLVVLSEIDGMGSSLRYGYVALFVFHVITLNWTGDYVQARDVYMMIAGAATIIVHPLFYCIPLAVYVAAKRTFGEPVALAALPFAWVGYEYTHSLSEWSFPWLTIGNSQSYDLARIQIASILGVYGLSLWIIVINVLGYAIYRRIGAGGWRRHAAGTVAWLAAVLVVFELPSVYGSWVLARDGSAPPDSARSITVGMVQSNIDPWEKWRSGLQTIELYERLSSALVQHHVGRKPDIILWPETALPYDVLYETNKNLLQGLEAEVADLDAGILTGMPHFVVYHDSAKAPPSAKRLDGTGERFDSFNAAAFFQPGVRDVPWYGKMKMVPLAERVPYADAFSFLDVFRWGVGIGGWQIGPDSTIFQERTTGARFSTMICYESVYPGFVASFVAKGAEFIALITIDSWWDKMSGAYQHQQFALFRAVENRRWIARCAVGGISCYIDPFGRVYDKTALFTQATLNRTIFLRDDRTFYTDHIDLAGKGCLAATGGVVIAVVAARILRKRGGRA